MTLEAIIAIRNLMHDRASDAFGAARLFGKNSYEHRLAFRAYKVEADAYEAICREHGIEPYATYSAD